MQLIDIVYFILTSFLTFIWLYSLIEVSQRYLRLGKFSTYSKHRAFLHYAFWFLCLFCLLLIVVDFALLQFKVSKLNTVTFEYLYSLGVFSTLWFYMKGNKIRV